MHKRVYDFLDQNKQIFKSQYGFRFGFESNKHSIAIFLDLSKTFDTLNHNILLAKMERYGIRGTCLDWFQSYLGKRTKQVKCNDTLSETKSINIGTPQGLCLGPLLFLLYCNDLYLHLEIVSCILFTDDTTLFKSHSDPKYLTWCMEHDLAILSDWFKANKLTLNTNKSVGIFFNHTNHNLKLTNVMVNEVQLPFVDSTKFLGVWVDSKLKWNMHVEKLIMKMHRGLGMLWRSRKLLSAHGKKMLYYAQVFSHLHYRISVWGSMCSKNQINKLSRIHNKFI